MNTVTVHGYLSTYTPLNINDRDAIGKTPLFKAIAALPKDPLEDNDPYIQQLLDMKADPNMRCSDIGIESTPLQQRFSNIQINTDSSLDAVMKQLLIAKADVDVSYNFSNSTILTTLFYDNNRSFIKLFLEFNANPNAQTKLSFAVLILNSSISGAIKEPIYEIRLDILTLLLEAGANPNTSPESASTLFPAGNPAYSIASGPYKAKELYSLITAYGAIMVDDNGQTLETGLQLMPETQAFIQSCEPEIERQKALRLERFQQSMREFKSGLGLYPLFNEHYLLNTLFDFYSKVRNPKLDGIKIAAVD